MRWPGEHGFDCTGLERSPGLTALAWQYSGQPVIAADFESFGFSPRPDICPIARRRLITDH